MYIYPGSFVSIQNEFFGQKLLTPTLSILLIFRIIMGERNGLTIAGSRLARSNGIDPLKFAVEKILKRQVKKIRIQKNCRYLLRTFLQSENPLQSY